MQEIEEWHKKFVMMFIW